jgi:hypothetical protein
MFQIWLSDHEFMNCFHISIMLHTFTFPKLLPMDLNSLSFWQKTVLPKAGKILDWWTTILWTNTATLTSSVTTQHAILWSTQNMHCYCIQVTAANNSIWLLPPSEKWVHATAVSLEKQDIILYSTEPGSFQEINESEAMKNFLTTTDGEKRITSPPS